MEWISVKDRLPKLPKKTQDITRIDVWIKEKRWPHRVTDAFIDSKGKFCKARNDGSWELLENVTHWMPLPEPPK